MKRQMTYLMCVLGTLGLVLVVPTVSAGDADAIADLSKGITEWELLSEDNNAEPPKQANVYVSSSLGRMAPANTEEVPVVNGLAAFDGEWRPVQTAQDYWYARRDAALRSARPNNWVWQGIRATGYEVTGKYIQHFPLFNPLSIERHTVKVIDPMRQYTPAQRIGAGVGLSWDVASPFGKTMLKAGGTRLLKQQANAAAGAPNITEFGKQVTQLQRSMIFMDRGIRTYDTISKTNRAVTIGADAYSTSGNAMRNMRSSPPQSSIDWSRMNVGASATRWNTGTGVSSSNIGSMRVSTPMPNVTHYPPPKILFSTKDPLTTYIRPMPQPTIPSYSTSPTYRINPYTPRMPSSVGRK